MVNEFNFQRRKSEWKSTTLGQFHKNENIPISIQYANTNNKYKLLLSVVFFFWIRELYTPATLRGIPSFISNQNPRRTRQDCVLSSEILNICNMVLAGMATVPRAGVLSQKRSVRGTLCRHGTTRVVHRRRGFYVQANDLNKWCVGCVDRVGSAGLHAFVSCKILGPRRDGLMGGMICRANLEGMDDQCDPNPFDKYVLCCVVLGCSVCHVCKIE